MRLDWRTIEANRSRQHVKGIEIECALPEGYRSRFMIYSVRCYDADWNADVRYRVRDVEAKGDDWFKAGYRAPIFGEYPTLDEALAAILPHAVTED